jgi:hypothetical protein
VESGRTTITKRMMLPDGAKFRANFTIDPEEQLIRVVEIRAQPIVADGSRARRDAGWRAVDVNAALDRYCLGMVVADLRDADRRRAPIDGRVRSCD